MENQMIAMTQEAVKLVRRLEIKNFDHIKFDEQTNQYVYDDGQKKYVLDPRNMIVRTNSKAPDSPVVYVGWSDRELKTEFKVRTQHPTRCWYKHEFDIHYYNVREITLKRWFKLNDDRKRYSDAK